MSRLICNLPEVNIWICNSNKLWIFLKTHLFSPQNSLSFIHKTI